jgi:hypothetical protein
VTLNGDPTVAGWTAFFLYFIAAFSAFRRARKTIVRERFQKAAWNLFGAIFVVLGFNKQLDLHNVLLQWLVSGMPSSNGGYLGVFRPIFTTVMVGSILTLAFGIFSLRSHLGTFALPLCGLALIAFYACIRAASLAQVDEAYHLHLDKYPPLAGLEMVGSLFLVAGANYPNLVRRVPNQNTNS